MTRYVAIAFDTTGIPRRDDGLGIDPDEDGPFNPRIVGIGLHDTEGQGGGCLVLPHDDLDKARRHLASREAEEALRFNLLKPADILRDGLPLKEAFDFVRDFIDDDDGTTAPLVGFNTRFLNPFLTDADAYDLLVGIDVMSIAAARLGRRAVKLDTAYEAFCTDAGFTPTSRAHWRAYQTVEVWKRL